MIFTYSLHTVSMADPDPVEDLKKLSSSLELRTVDGMGRGVFTKVSISAGATIFSALPIAHCSVKETRGSICEHCFKRSE